MQALSKTVWTPSTFWPQTGEDRLAQTPGQALGGTMLSSAAGASGEGTGRAKERGSKRVVRINCIVENWFR